MCVKIKLSHRSKAGLRLVEIELGRQLFSQLIRRQKFTIFAILSYTQIPCAQRESRPRKQNALPVPDQLNRFPKIHKSIIFDYNIEIM